MKKTFQVATTIGALLATVYASANEYDVLIKAKKYSEAEKVVAAKLAAEPNNAEALVAKTELIIIEGNEKRLDEAAKIAEQCIAANPKNSECQESLGRVLGTKAQKGGVMSAVGYAGKIRDAFKRAIELNPQNYSARGSLLQFYLQAPGFMGGGTGKAKDLIVETIKLSAAAGALLQANYDFADDNYQRAITGALAVNTSNNEEFAKQQRNVLSNIGHYLINEKKYAEAEKLFAEVGQRFPDSSAGFFGVGKSLQVQGKNKEATPYFEKAIAVDPTPVAYYRLAKALQAQGDKAKAIAHFENALAQKWQLSKDQMSDAESQLKSLKG